MDGHWLGGGRLVVDVPGVDVLKLAANCYLSAGNWVKSFVNHNTKHKICLRIPWLGLDSILCIFWASWGRAIGFIH